jgi:hypothetical protein
VLRAALAGLLAALACGALVAAETRIYKYVDENGKVVYSQTRPSNGAPAQRVEASPAYRGRGGDNAYPTASDNPAYYAGDDARYRAQQAAHERQRRREEAAARHEADLKARCNRGRGADCDDPRALRYMESTDIPRTTSVVRQVR